MATKKKGQLTTSPEWAKHLRKYMKKQFWKGERNAEKKLISDELYKTNNLLWQFNELIKNLISMSMPLEKQIDFYGLGVTADEMLEDFNSYYSLNKSRFFEKGLINEEIKASLEDIDNLTDKWTSEKDEDFWFEMEKHENDWNILREMAKSTLKKMELDNLTVMVKHENETENGKIIVQNTKIDLTEK